MKRALSLLLSSLLCMSSVSAQQASVSFYFSAHPDDWQLFMGVNAFRDIQAARPGSNNKVVFIYTTAGESNCWGAGVDASYYQARQDGANRSVQFCSDISSPHAAWSSSTLAISGVSSHNILRMTYKNVVSYYLLLPDGCYEHTPVSISKLADHSIHSLAAVDNSTTYHGYEDLVQTVKNIIDYESSTIPHAQVWIHASDWDNDINPEDHPDHVQTGRLATQAADRTDYANVMLFQGYLTCNQPANLSPEETAMEAALQSQVSFGLTTNGWSSEWDPELSCGHVEWTDRNYYRTYTSDIKTKALNTLMSINPNPARNTINLTYRVMEAGMVNIAVYDLFGNIRATIISEAKDPGIYTISYEAAGLPAANYIVCERAAERISTLKFTKL